jgi:hypothetical protein
MSLLEISLGSTVPISKERRPKLHILLITVNYIVSETYVRSFIALFPLPR